tara:strand:+ start:1293 stop:1529 length:237 start_codon:yes stop_codon:yes gene_type:complete
MAYARQTGSGNHYKGMVLLNQDGTHKWELSERASTDEITGSGRGSGVTLVTRVILAEGTESTYDAAAAALKTAWDTYK